MGAAGTDTLDQPCDVVTDADGTIYVADGHGGQLPGAGPHTTARVVRFAADGTYLGEWGSHGSSPGQFRTPHAIDLDSHGRVVVADRGNDRLQVFRGVWPEMNWERFVDLVNSVNKEARG